MDSENVDNVIAAFREVLSEQVCEAIGDKGFSDMAVIMREALQRERADVAGQFEALAKALRATAEAVDIGL